MFSFVVKNLGSLKNIPLLPWVFDVWLRLFTIIFKREVSIAIDAVEAELTHWQYVTVSMHKYGGLQFNYKNKELGHIHGNGLTDVLFNREIKQGLLSENLVADHHVFTKSGWVSFQIKTAEDANQAINIFIKAYIWRKQQCSHI